MDTIHVDTLLQSLKSAISRRGVLTALTGGVLATGIVSHAEDEAAARKKGKRRKKRKNKNRKDKNRAKVRADATCPGSEDFALQSGSGDDRMAQSFTANASGPLVKAQLSIGKGFSTTGDFVVRLQPLDDTGTPIEEVLAEVTVADSAVPDIGGFIDFTFAQPFSVVAGEEYALVLTRPGGGAFQWSFEKGNPCGGEAFFAFGQNEPLTPNNDDNDHTFTTFVKS